MGNKIKPPDRRGTGKIPPPSPPADAHLTISFKYFDHRPPFVFPEDELKDYPLTLFERLRDLCQATPHYLRHPGNSKSLRSHPIEWEKTTQPNGFEHLNTQFREQIVAWQFTVSANQYGRIHGFWIDDVFYIVWIDPKHKLYA